WVTALPSLVCPRGHTLHTHAPGRGRRPRRTTSRGPGERLTRFELKGAVGEWSLELPTDPAPFDLPTMTDVVLLFRYTARDGGQPLSRAASANLRGLITAAGGQAR